MTDITKAQANYLIRLSKKGDSSGNSRMRDRLRKAGYIRLTSPDDNRRQGYELSPLGRLRVKALTA